jgi:hypothetical protein
MRVNLWPLFRLVTGVWVLHYLRALKNSGLPFVRVVFTFGAGCADNEKITRIESELVASRRNTGNKENRVSPDYYYYYYYYYYVHYFV